MGCAAARPAPQTAGAADVAKQPLTENSVQKKVVESRPSSLASLPRQEDSGQSRHSVAGSVNESSRRRTWVKDDMGFKANLSKMNVFAALEGKYKFGNLLGEGITGQVRLCTSIVDGHTYAMKSLNVLKMDESQVAELKAEIDMLRKVDHPCVVSLIEVFESPNNICLVMEYCSGGDLSDRRFKTELELASVIHQVMLAVAHCHNIGIIHRDIKMENILFSTKDKDYIRLIDFGLSKSFFTQNSRPSSNAISRTNTNNFASFPDSTTSLTSLTSVNERSRLMETVCGTIVYMAPEVLKRKYTEKADIWAIGIVAFTLMTGTAPFVASDDTGIMRMVKRGHVVYDENVWKRLTPAAKDFVQALLTVDPEKRLSAKQALLHPWLVNYRQQKEIRKPMNHEFCKRVCECLIRFLSYPLIKKVALMVIAYHSRVDEMYKLQEVFMWLDEDFTGELAVSNVYKLIKHYGDTERYPEDTFQEVFNFLDQDRTGFVHQMEFLSATIETVITPSKQLLNQAFDHLDAESSGAISVDSLQELLGSSYSREDAEHIVKAGYESLGMTPRPEISREHFFAMMEKVFEVSASDSPSHDAKSIASTAESTTGTQPSDPMAPLESRAVQSGVAGLPIVEPRS